MTNALKRAWTELVQPLLQRPKRMQVAALCYRIKGADKEVLMITSRDTGRWILPKGWPIDGLDASGAALQEAWEEAGVREGKISNESIGSFEYQKELDTGGHAICETKVFAVEVEKLEDVFPEAKLRTRQWMSPYEAANLVNEPGLRDILNNL